MLMGWDKQYFSWLDTEQKARRRQGQINWIWPHKRYLIRIMDGTFKQSHLDSAEGRVWQESLIPTSRLWRVGANSTRQRDTPERTRNLTHVFLKCLILMRNNLLDCFPPVFSISPRRDFVGKSRDLHTHTHTNNTFEFVFVWFVCKAFKHSYRKETKNN